MLAGALLASAASLVLATVAAGTFPGRNGKIAFTGGDYDIYVVNPDGSGRRQLTRGPGADLNPKVSRDGRKIAFRRVRRDDDPDFYVVRSNGIDLRRVPGSRPSDCCPAFSPDGRYIAFDSDRRGDTVQIWVMRADGTRPRQLTYGDETSGGAAYSPDGRTIAFTRRDGIYIMNGRTSAG